MPSPPLPPESPSGTTPPRDAAAIAVAVFVKYLSRQFGENVSIVIRDTETVDTKKTCNNGKMTLLGTLSCAHKSNMGKTNLLQINIGTMTLLVQVRKWVRVNVNELLGTYYRAILRNATRANDS